MDLESNSKNFTLTEESSSGSRRTEYSSEYLSLRAARRDRPLVRSWLLCNSHSCSCWDHDQPTYSPPDNSTNRDTTQGETQRNNIENIYLNHISGIKVVKQMGQETNKSEFSYSSLHREANTSRGLQSHSYSYRSEPRKVSVFTENSNNIIIEDKNTCTRSYERNKCNSTNVKNVSTFDRDSDRRCAEKTTYCRPIVNVNTREFLRKTTERDNKLKGLIKKIVEAREKEKQTEAWHNYINELKNKHDYTDETVHKPYRYITEQRCNPYLTNNYLSTSFETYSANHLLHDFYRGHSPKQMRSDLATSNQNGYDNANRLRYSKQRPNVYENAPFSYPMSSQGRYAMMRKERERAREEGYMLTRDFSRDPAMIVTDIEQSRKRHTKRQTIDAAVQTEDDIKKGSRSKSKESILQRIRSKRKNDSKKDLTLGSNENEIDSPTIVTKNEAGTQDDRKSFQKDSATQDEKTDIEKIGSIHIIKEPPQKDIINKNPIKDTQKEDNVQRENILTVEDDPRYEVLDNIDNKLNLLLNTVNSLLKDLQNEGVQLPPPKSKCDLTLCTKSDGNNYTTSAIRCLGRIYEDINRSIVTNNEGNINNNKTDSNNNNKITDNIESTNKIDNKNKKNEKLVCLMIDNSANTIYPHSTSEKNIAVDRGVSQIDEILTEELDKSKRARRDINDILERELYRPCGVQITFDIPTKDIATEVTTSSKVKVGTNERSFGELRSVRRRRMTISTMNTDPLSLLSLLSISTDTISRLLSSGSQSILSRTATGAGASAGSAGDVSEDRQHFVCSMCGATFLKATELSDHIEHHDTVSPRDCHICRHLLDSHGHNDLFMCQYCDKCYTRACCCQLHQQTCPKRVRGKHQESASRVMLI